MKLNKRTITVGIATATILGAALLATLGKSFYVSPTGSDTNAGTQSAPLRTIDKAISLAGSGDSVIVTAGTYPSFTISKSNIALIGEGFPLISGGYGIKCNNASTNVTIQGFEVVGASSTSYNGAIYLNGCNNSVVTGNKVHNNTGNLSGIIINGSNNKITYNEAYENGFSGIRIYGNSLNNEIGFNKAYNNTASAGNSDGIDLADVNVTGTNIHDNIVWGNSDDGIDTWTSAGNVIQNNETFRNGGTGDGNGIKAGGSVTGGNNRVLNNVSHDNVMSGFTSNGGGNYYEGNKSYNNGEYGFSDGWRNSGNTMVSSFVNNNAYGNIKGNFKYLPAFTASFVGNSELGVFVTVLPTNTFTIAPVTATAQNLPSLTPTASRTPVPTGTRTNTPVSSQITVNGTVIPCPCVISVP